LDDLDVFMKKLSAQKPFLRDQYGVNSLGIFGSYIRGEQKKKSDVDILIDFENSISLLSFVALEYHLSDVLGKKVDLVMKSALKPRIGKQILRDVIYI
jgi:predicted nucleotidyltransferase